MKNQNQKLPFRIIVDRVLELYDAFYIASGEMKVILQDEIHMYLTESGWDSISFDIELMKIINGNWETNVN